METSIALQMLARDALVLVVSQLTEQLGRIPTTKEIADHIFCEQAAVEASSLLLHGIRAAERHGRGLSTKELLAA